MQTLNLHVKCARAPHLFRHILKLPQTRVLIMCWHVRLPLLDLLTSNFHRPNSTVLPLIGSTACDFRYQHPRFFNALNQYPVGGEPGD